MATVRDVVQSSLEEIGAYAPGETVTDADAERALDQLNKMLDLWSNESLACYAILEQTVTLTIGVASYTIGSGGAINLTRPLRILEGPGAAYIKDTNNNRYAVDVVPRDVWNQIGLLTATSNIPHTLFYDPQFPLGVINIFPVPLSAFGLYWDSYQQLARLATLDTAISFPPGYETAIQDNLAVRCGPFFKNAVVSTDAEQLAIQAKRSIKPANRRTNIAVYDKEIVSRASPTYNIFRDKSGT